MKKWIPAAIGILGYLSALIDPHITNVVAHWAVANPDVASTLAAILLAIYHGLESPVKRSGAKN